MKKTELLIDFSSQNTFLFGVKLSDYHSRTKIAASRSSAINNFDAINRRQFFLCQMQWACKTGARIWCGIYGTNFWCWFLERVYEALEIYVHIIFMYHTLGDCCIGIIINCTVLLQDNYWYLLCCIM